VAALLAPLALSACSVKEDEGDLIAGKQAFVKKCGSCHILNRAGSKGITGPNLDEAFRQGLADGLGKDGVRGVVRGQIANPSMPGVKGSGQMPADLATGKEAEDISAYVAAVAARPGEDTGLLASAVPKAGGGKPIAAKDGTVTIPADPSGALLYTSELATAAEGPLKVSMPNESGVPHNIVIDEKGETPVIEKGEVDFSAEFSPGEYVYYCSVPGHREAGMEGKLTVE
jgi:mono/diheme cytochrome c family protein